MNKQFLLILDGPMGGGKTTVSKLLFEKLDKTLFTGFDKIKFTISGYSRTSAENEVVAGLVASLTFKALDKGLNVCVEQGFMKSEFLEPYIRKTKELDIPIFIFQLEAPREVLLSRILNRPKAEHAKQPISQEKVEKNLDTYFTYKYKRARIIDTSKKSPASIAEEIFEYVNNLDN